MASLGRGDWRTNRCDLRNHYLRSNLRYVCSALQHGTTAPSSIRHSEASARSHCTIDLGLRPEVACLVSYKINRWLQSNPDTGNYPTVLPMATFARSLLLSFACLGACQASALPSGDNTIVLRDYDYVVVGSGPGGAPLAARLGLAGYKVLVIEAGVDIAATDYNATVPLFNGKASEDPKMAWNFFVCCHDALRPNNS